MLSNDGRGIRPTKPDTGPLMALLSMTLKTLFENEILDSFLASFYRIYEQDISRFESVIFTEPKACKF